MQLSATVGTKSHTFCVPSLVAALEKAQDFLGKCTWRPNGLAASTQRYFLDFYESSNEIIPGLECISAIADPDIQIINAWLRERGMNDAQLRNQPGRGGFATASILDILVNWQRPGIEARVSYEDSHYPAFTLKQGFALYRTPYANPVASLQTQEGYGFYLTIADRDPGPDFKLLDAILAIRNVNPSDSRPIRGYDGVTLPMVNLNQKPDLSWLVGLIAEGTDGSGFVSEAAGQNKFRMNQYGARAQSAVAVGVSRGISNYNFYEFNQPFYLWIDAPDGMKDHLPPLFCAYLGPDVWEDPGDLTVD